MNRQDIVAKMNPHEKEIFEKYKNTYPFPTRKFIEEIGIKIEYDDDQNPKNQIKMIEKIDATFCMVISSQCKKTKKEQDLILLCQLIYHLFTKNDLRYNESTYSMGEMPEETIITLCAFLMPSDIFKKQILKFQADLKKIAKYFGIWPGMIEFYSKYVVNETIGLDPYSNSRDNIQYH